MSILQYTDLYGANVLKHLLDDVAGLPSDSPIRTALVEEGITTVVNLLNLLDEDINTLSYFDGADMRLLHKGARSMLCLLIAYIRKFQADPQFDLLVDYTQLNSTGFAYFRIQEPPTPSIDSPMMTPPLKSPTPVPPLACTTSPVESFCCNIKRDPTQFPTLKDEKENDSWHY
jgi:hypothetical protein